MSTLHKVKAYFGMAPMDDYDDEYYDDEDRPSRGYPRRERFADEGYGRYDDRYDDEEMPGGYRGGYQDEGRLRPREFDRPAPRFAPLRGSFDKVATNVFLLSPADIDVTAEERRRIAEAGFYAYQ